MVAKLRKSHFLNVSNFQPKKLLKPYFDIFAYLMPSTNFRFALLEKTSKSSFKILFTNEIINGNKNKSARNPARGSILKSKHQTFQNSVNFDRYSSQR